MREARRLWLRLGRFSLVGFMGAVLQLLLLFLLTACFDMPRIAAAAAAVELVVLHNFLWHERFTWGDRRTENIRDMAIRLCRFHAANGVISLLGNVALMYYFAVRLKLPVMPSAVAAIALCSGANFLLADHWVYAEDPAAVERS